MRAEILITGDEIRRGYITDTNSAYISNMLEMNGIEVVRHTSVGDEICSISNAILEISSRADIAIVTGGLGSTFDDLTSKTISRLIRVPMVFNNEAFDSIRSFLKNSPMKIKNSYFEQSFLPKGVDCIKNEQGIAPGFSIMIGKCNFFLFLEFPKKLNIC